MKLLSALLILAQAVSRLATASSTGAMVQSEFIFDHASFPSCHASTIAETKSGLVVAWFGGSAERNPDVCIYVSRQVNGAWTPPAMVANGVGFSTNRLPTWNPVLFHGADGRLWLYYKFGKSPDTWAGARRFSDDEGRTWSAEERLPKGFLGPIKDKPLVLGDGTIVSGSSVEHGDWTVWIERSADSGKTWTKNGPIRLPKSVDMLAPIATPRKKTVGIIQPTIVQLDGGHLRFYARSKSRSARIAAADSYDEGKTWSEPHFIDLPNPNSGIDAVRLRDGRVVLIFNNSYTDRTPLNLAVSRDGEHFSVFKTLEDAPGEYSYPAIIQAADGGLLMTYTWHRETIKFVRIPLSTVPQS